MKTDIGIGFWSAIAISQVWAATGHVVLACLWIAFSVVIGYVEDSRQSNPTKQGEHA